MPVSIYDFTVRDADDRAVALRHYRGRALLIVNVASRCGFTPQYRGLQELFNRFGPRGLVVLGFPCNQFGAQEPGEAAAARDFCALEYRVTFPVMAKIEVNGAAADPLFAWLKARAPGALGSEGIKWNFTKFLVDRSGASVRRFAPLTPPEKLSRPIEALLAGS